MLPHVFFDYRGVRPFLDLSLRDRSWNQFRPAAKLIARPGRQDRSLARLYSFLGCRRSQLRHEARRACGTTVHFQVRCLAPSFRSICRLTAALHGLHACQVVFIWVPASAAGTCFCQAIER